MPHPADQGHAQIRLDRTVGTGFNSWMLLVILLALLAAAAAPGATALPIPENTWVQQPAPVQVLPPGCSGIYESHGWNHLRYDSVARAMILYDGYVEPPTYPVGNIYANSLWLYDVAANRLTLERLNNWTRVNDVTVPLPANTTDPTPFDRHSYSCIVYSASMNRVYLWSGANSGIESSHLGDTWTYDLGTHVWREIQGPHPCAVLEQACSYDPSREKIVLFGGSAFDYGDGRKTYVFDLESETWSDPAPSPQPTARYGQTLCFDPVRRITWMFGGGAYGEATSELWSYDLDSNLWTRSEAEGPWPSARRFANMAYDTKRDIILMWGGVTAANVPLTDTWLFNPATRAWKRRSPPRSPSVTTRSYAEDMDYDPENDVFVLNTGGAFWLYRYDDDSPEVAEDSEPEFAVRMLSANPATDGAAIGFTLAREEPVRVDLFDLSGHLIDTLADARYPAGDHVVHWSGNVQGARARSGVYFTRFMASNHRVTRKFVLVR